MSPVTLLYCCCCTVAVSLLSTERYHSLTMTRVLVGFLSLHVRGQVYVKLSLVSRSPLLHFTASSASDQTPAEFIIGFFVSFPSISISNTPQSLWPPRAALGICSSLTFSGRSGELTSKECISHKLNSTIAGLVHLEEMHLNRHFFHLSRNPCSFVVFRT